MFVIKRWFSWLIDVHYFFFKLWYEIAQIKIYFAWLDFFFFIIKIGFKLMQKSSIIGHQVYFKWTLAQTEAADWPKRFAPGVAAISSWNIRAALHERKARTLSLIHVRRHVWKQRGAGVREEARLGRLLPCGGQSYVPRGNLWLPTCWFPEERKTGADWKWKKQKNKTGHPD